RVRLFFRDRVKLLASSVTLPEPPTGPVHDAIRTHLASAGASSWPDLVTAAGTADDAVLLTALWDLVWAGEVTNDTFGPLRVPRRASARRSARGRPHPGPPARRDGRGPAALGAGWRGSARPRARASGRSSHRCSSPRHRPPRPRTRSRSNS